MNPDIAIFHVINDFAGVWPPLDWITQLLVNDFVVPTLMSLAAIWLWVSGKTPDERQRNQRAVLMMALGIFLGNALIKDLSYVYFRPRPFATETVKLLFYRPSVSSFPSVPIEVAFSFAMGAWYANKTLGNWLFWLAGLYGLARVLAGVHFPSDILGGAIIGIGAVYIVARLRFFFEPAADSLIRLARRLSFA